MNKKNKRQSGWVTPQSTIGASKDEIIAECLEPQVMYSDWDDYRDSQRDYFSDRTLLKTLFPEGAYVDAEQRDFVMANNSKLTTLNRRRSARKYSRGLM